MTELDTTVGLSAAEVARRHGQGLGNVTTHDGRRTVADIVRANLLTRFNAILGSLLVVVLLTGEYRDALFGIVLVTNALIGIVQELRAKATLDRLRVVTTPSVTVLRDGELAEVPAEDLVAGDVVELQAGDQVPVDGSVLTSAELEVDESLLTGESDPVVRGPGEKLLSGSFVVAGHGRFEATDVGDAAYAARLTQEARRFASVRSELRTGTDTILRLGTWALLPAGALLFFSQLQLRHSMSLSESLRSSVAGVGAMIPEGLVLLTNVAFALGVIRLGRRHALVQELAAVEVLARVDVVCVDKTGTLTEGRLSVHHIDQHGGQPDQTTLDALGALVACEPKPNASLRPIGEAAPDPGWTAEHRVPFSSARKWSGARFTGQGSWVLGAPDILLAPEAPEREEVDALAASGLRVLLLVRCAGELTDAHTPQGEPVALVALQERVRTEVEPALRFFADQGVAVKVISGDHPVTVGAVADRVGVVGGDSPVDARDLPHDLDELGLVLEESSVFGRVQPRQKRAMVQAMQRRGHVVAMTGDGVNDVLALKDADLGVAMGSGSGATRGVAQIVLLDDSFESLPAVVAEGRRVIANVERVANLFVTKSVYAFLLAVSVGIARFPFPFLPRHLTIVSSLTIGIPAFFLALAPNDERARPGFLRRVATFALPAGTVAAAATFAGYATAQQVSGESLGQERTAALMILFLIGLWILVILARPVNTWRTGLVASMAGVFAAVMLIPSTREFFELTLPSVKVGVVAASVAAGAMALLEAGWRRFSPHHRAGAHRR